MGKIKTETESKYHVFRVPKLDLRMRLLYNL